MRPIRLRSTVRFLLAAAATAALGLTGLAAPASASPLDIPPRGANDWSCKPDSAHPQPVVLVNGTFKLMVENWAALSPKLKEAGYCVFAFNYGHMETDPIPQAAAELRDFVEAVRGATGAAKVDIVGHSQGGMMPRYYVKFLGGADKVDDLIGIVPSNHGTKNPLAIPAGWTFCPSCVDQQFGSDLMKKLNAGDETPADPGLHGHHHPARRGRHPLHQRPADRAQGAPHQRRAPGQVPARPVHARPGDQGPGCRTVGAERTGPQGPGRPGVPAALLGLSRKSGMPRRARHRGIPERQCSCQAASARRALVA
ncbi:hypothetical protein GCM10020000_65850 [Streptomyces olivoverticillatus]